LVCHHPASVSCRRSRDHDAGPIRGPKVPDLRKRGFIADTTAPHHVGDITYLPVADVSNLYLATVIDCYCRRLLGWAVAENLCTSLAQHALTVAP